MWVCVYTGNAVMGLVMYILVEDDVRVLLLMKMMAWTFLLSLYLCDSWYIWVFVVQLEMVIRFATLLSASNALLLKIRGFCWTRSVFWMIAERPLLKLFGMDVLELSQKDPTNPKLSYWSIWYLPLAPLQSMLLLGEVLLIPWRQSTGFLYDMAINQSPCYTGMNLPMSAVLLPPMQSLLTGFKL